MHETGPSRGGAACRTGRVLAAVALLGPLAMPSFADEAGTALAQRVYDRPDGSDMATRGKMILTEEGHAPRERTMYTYGRDTDAGDFWSLIRFSSPADIEDTGLLSQETAAGEEDQWIYLPALKRSRRIAATRKGGRFVGSDLYYEDLQDRKVAEDHHEIVGQDPIEAAPTTVLVSTPVDPGNSAYSKRKSWIYEKILIPLRVDFYEASPDRPRKRLKVHRVQKIQGYWTVMDSTMTDLETGHRTRVVVENIEYDQGIPDPIFTVKALEDPALERPYRP